MNESVSYDQPSAAPSSKVASSAIAGSVTIILVYLVRILFNTEVPAEVASAITVVVSFAAGYLVKERVSKATVKAIAKEIK